MAAILSISPRPSPTCSTICSAEIMGGGRGAAPENRGGDLRYNLQVHAGRGLSRPPRRDQSSFRRSLFANACSGSGAAPAPMPSNVRPAPATARCAATAGILHRRAHLSAVSRQRPRRQKSLQILRRRRPCAEERTLAVDIPPPGGPSRKATRIRPFGRRPRPVSAAGRRATSMFFSRCPARDLPARRPRSALPGAGVVSTTAALAEAMKCRRLDGGRAKITRARGRAIGPPVPPARQRQCRLLRGGGMARRSLYRAGGGNSRSSSPRSSRRRSCANSRAPGQGCQPECDSFFARVKEFWNAFQPRSTDKICFWPLLGASHQKHADFGTASQPH